MVDYVTINGISVTDDVLPLEDFLPYRLNRLADAVSREFSKIYRDRHGLTRPEWRTLATLGQFGEMTATEIGRHSAMHKTKVSRAVQELDRRKWLTRKPDPNDRRIEWLRLTSAGARIYQDLVPLARGFEARFLGSLDAGEREAILRALALLENAAALQPNPPRNLD
jgi:DNA-binding MarR family transcriptional regulator